MPPVLFASGSATSRAPQLNSERLVNAFVEKQPQSAKSQSPIFGAPGVTAFSTAGTSPNRGSWNFNGAAYFVQGSSLYTVAADGTAVQAATGIAGAGPVGISDNGQQLCVVNGAQGYIYTTGGGLVPITSTAFYPCRTVTFMDGYFIFDRFGTNEYFISALYDGLSYNGLDFASAEAQPGFVVGTAQNLQLLFIFCTGHIEMWYDAGAAAFPFQRYAGGVINYGTVSPYSIIKQDGAIFFLGADHVFYRLQANTPIRISTHPIETIIEQDPDISQAVSSTYTIQGHKMVQLDLPASNRTLVFDISTGQWHERQSWTSNTAGNVVNLGRWRGSHALEIYGKVILGDAFDGRIGELDWTVFTEYGGIMPMICRSTTLHADRKRLFMSRFELDMEAGVGLTTGQGSNPQVMLRYSRDGGKTWSKEELWRSLGKLGEYNKRLRWMKMGQGFQYTFELLITDPVFRTIIQAHADMEQGL